MDSQLPWRILAIKMYNSQIFALLGHNGADKTANIKMLAGIMIGGYLINKLSL